MLILYAIRNSFGNYDLFYPSGSSLAYFLTLPVASSAEIDKEKMLNLFNECFAGESTYTTIKIFGYDAYWEV